MSTLLIEARESTVFHTPEELAHDRQIKAGLLAQADEQGVPREIFYEVIGTHDYSTALDTPFLDILAARRLSEATGRKITFNGSHVPENLTDEQRSALNARLREKTWSLVSGRLSREEFDRRMAGVDLVANNTILTYTPILTAKRLTEGMRTQRPAVTTTESPISNKRPTTRRELFLRLRRTVFHRK